MFKKMTVFTIGIKLLAQKHRLCGDITNGEMLHFEAFR